LIKKGYKDLEIYQLAYNRAMDVHTLSMKLPKYELFEEGSQLRRSTKSIVTNIVEGYGRRKYKNDFIKFLIYAHSSCDESKVHLNFIYDSGYISKKQFKKFYESYDKIGQKVYNLIVTTGAIMIYIIVRDFGFFISHSMITIRTFPFTIHHYTNPFAR